MGSDALFKAGRNYNIEWKDGATNLPFHAGARQRRVKSKEAAVNDVTILRNSQKLVSRNLFFRL
jgi:hypothetical protein